MNILGLCEDCLFYQLDLDDVWDRAVYENFQENGKFCKHPICREYVIQCIKKELGKKLDNDENLRIFVKPYNTCKCFQGKN